MPIGAWAESLIAASDTTGLSRAKTTRICGADAFSAIGLPRVAASRSKARCVAPDWLRRACSCRARYDCSRFPLRGLVEREPPHEGSERFNPPTPDPQLH